MVALALVLVAWLVSSAFSGGHRTVSPNVAPPGLPPSVVEHLPNGFFDDLPDDADFTDSVPPEWLDRLAGELSPEEMEELSGELSDETRAELLQRMAGELDEEDLQRLAEGLDEETIAELREEIDAEDPEFDTEEFDWVDEDPTGPQDADETEPDEPRTEESQEDEAASEDESEEDSDEAWWATLLKAIGKFLLYLIPVSVGVALLALVGLGVFRFLRDLANRPRRAAAPPPPPEQQAVEQLREAVRDGMSDIDSGTDPRTAVIACWRNLETAAADAGIPRYPSDTPTDLVRRLLESINVDDSVLSDLMHAYHLARYAPHDVSEELRGVARDALAAVDSALAVAVAEREKKKVTQ